VAEETTTGRPEIKVQPTKKAMDPKVLFQLKQARENLHRIFGQVALALSQVPQYRNMPASEFTQAILEPLIQDRLLVAHSAKDSDPATDGGLLGIALWASVSATVDAKIRTQIKEKVFPVRLQRDEWKSGDTVWLLDVIAPNEAAAEKVLAGLAKHTKARELNVHPKLNLLVKKQK
jgi:cytolysin-activating lysine-acyltransferase